MSEKKHVMFVGAGHTSHLIHMQGLAEAVAARGYRVSFAALQTDKSFVSSSELVNFVSCGTPVHDAAFFNYTETIQELFQMNADYSEHLYEKLCEIIGEGHLKDRPHLIAFDHCFWPGVHALSLKFEIPAVMLLPARSDLEFLGQQTCNVPMICSGVPAPVKGMATVKNAAMLMVCRQILARQRAGQHQKCLLKHADIPFKDYASHPYGKERLIIHGSFPGIAECPSMMQPTLNTPLCQSTGPWLPRKTKALPHDIKTFLDQGKTMLIAIGTNSEWNDKLSTVFVEALRRCQGEFQVLWSIKPKQKEAVIAASPEAAALSGVMMVGFVDQFSVLQHPNTACFASHCGFGSYQEALYCGVPLLAMPMMLESDQPTNAARAVHNLRVGLSFDARPGHDEISADALEAKLRLLLADSCEFRTNALRYATQSKLLKGPERAADLLEMALLTDVTNWQPVDGSP